VSERFKAIARQLGVAIYPPMCRTCLLIIRPGAVFCDACIVAIKPIVSKIFPVTRHYTLKVFAVTEYKEPLRDLVTKKFYGDVVATRQLATLMTRFIPLRDMPIDYLVPVPLHWTRYAVRGYNQTYTMAKILGEHCNTPVKRLLWRTRKTAFQWSLSAADRQENVKEAFGLHPWYQWQEMAFLEGKHIVLVDDLCTTGATLIQMAKALAPYKPASISAVVACRAV